MPRRCLRRSRRSERAQGSDDRLSSWSLLFRFLVPHRRRLAPAVVASKAQKETFYKATSANILNMPWRHATPASEFIKLTMYPRSGQISALGEKAGTLPRRFDLAVPIFLIALLAQIWAPVAACLAMPSDAPAGLSSVMCAHSHGASPAKDSLPGSENHGNHSCCPTCVLAHGIIAPLLAVVFAILLAPQPPTRRFRSASPSTPPARWIVFSARPRAPPAFS